MQKNGGDKKRFKVDHFSQDPGDSKIKKYSRLFVGREGWLPLLKYELIVLLASWIPGAIGLFLRSKLYPLILGSVGRNVVFGCHVTFRYPSKIRIGSNSIIDDNCLLDAKGENNVGITIGDDVYIGRNTILSCKDGDIELRDHVNIGFNCEIFSSGKVVLEDYALLAAYCYVIGGGNYDHRLTGLPISQQPLMNAKGIVIGKNSWLGARATVLDGSRIGDDSIIGACSLVGSDIPPRSIAVGTPARVSKERPTA